MKHHGQEQQLHYGDPIFHHANKTNEMKPNKPYQSSQKNNLKTKLNTDVEFVVDIEFQICKIDLQSCTRFCIRFAEFSKCL